jgi:hypothetical protein
MRRLRPFVLLVIGVIAAVVILTALAFVTGHLRLVSMGSKTMEGESASGKRDSIEAGDLVLVTKGIFAPPRRGALVVVDLVKSGQNVTTIRRVAAAPGDRIPGSSESNGVTTIPPGYYYVLAYSTNGLDSRQLGLVCAAQIKGRVLFVIK